MSLVYTQTFDFYPNPVFRVFDILFFYPNRCFLEKDTKRKDESSTENGLFAPTVEVFPQKRVFFSFQWKNLCSYLRWDTRNEA